MGRSVAKLIRAGLVSGWLTEQQAAAALYTAMREGLAPDREFENMAYYFGDGVDLALQGVHGNLADLRSEMLEYLAKVKDDAPPDDPRLNRD